MKTALSKTEWKKWIKPGNRVFIGSGAACPNGLMKDFLMYSDHFHDIELIHILTLGGSPWISEENCEKFRVNSLFLGESSRFAVSKGIADYTPCFLSEIPRLFSEHTLAIDVALISVSPPDKYGYCSMGVSVDIVSSAAHSAKHIIAQVNPNMPRTMGRSFIHISKITELVEIDEPLPEIPPPILDEVTMKIGKYVSTLVEDGSTLQMGIGKIPDAVLSYLGDRKDLGIHTEMFSDGVLDLYEKGVITNAKKTINPHITTTSFCMGTKKLYDFVDNNPHIEFHPSEYVNSPLIIAQNNKMVSINSAIEVDLTGQVVSDSVGYRFYSGIGGQVDFIRGAALCPNGIPVIALPSTCKNGTISKIVPCLTQGSGVVTSRGDIHYVVTEYGIATLRGRSIRERALELIQIAHPKFREKLLSEVREHYWVPSYQEKKPTSIEEMGNMDFKKLYFKDKPYVLRALKPSDERRLQEFFYSHDIDTIFQRYRSNKNQMSREHAYKLVNVDETVDLGLCIVERQGPRETIHAIARYYLDPDTEKGEIAFVVRESLRGQGMATCLLKEIIEIAEKRKVKQLYAYTRRDNIPMIKILNKIGFQTIPSDDPTESYLVKDLEACLQT